MILPDRTVDLCHAPLASVEGYIRQLIGWRDYIWHVYWHFGSGYRRRNALRAHARLPKWFANLDARCLRDVLAQVRDHGRVHHIPRLMVLSNYALQRGWNPAAVTDWFHRCFVDGYHWVMVANVVGMSLHADGGLMATKPYAAGGTYINRMSDAHWAWKVAGVPATRHRVDPAGDGARVSISVPWWSAPYLTVCSIALRRMDTMLTGAP